MPTKAGLSQTQKLEKILAYFHESATCHTLKDLEATIPTITKIHKMQVKDLIKELTDTNQVKVEKIGSGNWYWAWAGEQSAERRQAIIHLEAEEFALKEAVAKLQDRLNAIDQEELTWGKDDGRQSLLREVELLETDVKSLHADKKVWEIEAAGSAESRMAAIIVCKAQAVEATDNIYALEDFCKNKLQMDMTTLEALRVHCYGAGYREGEGLRDVDDTVISSTSP